jgi:hypothetical protein
MNGYRTSDNYNIFEHMELDFNFPFALELRQALENDRKDPFPLLPPQSKWSSRVASLSVLTEHECPVLAVKLILFIEDVLHLVSWHNFSGKSATLFFYPKIPYFHNNNKYYNFLMNM